MRKEQLVVGTQASYPLSRLKRAVSLKFNEPIRQGKIGPSRSDVHHDVFRTDAPFETSNIKDGSNVNFRHGGSMRW